MQSGEQCDDGNAASGDGCSATCQVEFCTDPAHRICGDFAFEAQSGGADPVPLLPGVQWDCISSGRDYTKYVLEVSQAGGIQLRLTGHGGDIDFVAYGPYPCVASASDQ